MKQYTFEKHIFYDLDQERKRIEDVFDDMPRWQKRLNHIVDLFEKEKWAECIIAIDKLPYCKKGGCSGQEYVASFIKSLAYAIVSPKVFGVSSCGWNFMDAKEYQQFVEVKDIKRIPKYKSKLSEKEKIAILGVDEEESELKT